jgi:hypothetical protein
MSLGIQWEADLRYIVTSISLHPRLDADSAQEMNTKFDAKGEY